MCLVFERGEPTDANEGALRYAISLDLMNKAQDEGLDLFRLYGLYVIIVEDNVVKTVARDKELL